MPGLRVITGGQPLIWTGFTQQVAGSAVPIFTDAALSLQITFPISVGADTTYFYNDAWDIDCAAAFTEPNGINLGSFTVRAHPGGSAAVQPRMTQAQIEASAARAGGAFAPFDHGYLGWSFDPAVASGTGVALTTAGTVYTVQIPIAQAGTATNIVYDIVTAGGTLTAAQCFAGLYSPAGVLLGTTADLSTPWASTGVTVSPLVTPAAVSPGLHRAAFFFNGTTGPSLLKANIRVSANAGQSAANSRFSSADTGRTTTLAATLGARTATVNAYWAAIS